MFSAYAFSVYGESSIIMVQNFIIILLMWQYNKKIGTAEKFGVLVFFTAYLTLCLDLSGQGFLNADHWQMITGANTVMSKLTLLFIIHITIFIYRHHG